MSNLAGNSLKENAGNPIVQDSLNTNSPQLTATVVVGTIALTFRGDPETVKAIIREHAEKELQKADKELQKAEKEVQKAKYWMYVGVGASAVAMSFGIASILRARNPIPMNHSGSLGHTTDNTKKFFPFLFGSLFEKKEFKKNK